MDPIATAHYGMMAASHRLGDESATETSFETPQAEAAPENGVPARETPSACG